MSSVFALFAGPYNVALTLAVAVAFSLALRAGRRAGFETATWSALLLGAAAAGLFGSTVVSLAGTPLAPGAKSNVGGLAVGIPVALALSWWLRTGAWRTLDLLAVPTLVGLAIGRIGCFVAGCCVGTSSTLPWAVHYDGDELDSHPVQLYESLGDALLAIGVSRVAPMREPGVRASAAIGGYALLRFATEFLRAGRVPAHGLNPVQWWMLLVISVVGARWLLLPLLRAVRTAWGRLRARRAAMRQAPCTDVPRHPQHPLLRRDRLALVVIGVVLYVWPFLARTQFTSLEATLLQLMALGSLALALWTMQRAGRATRLVAPSLGAMLLLQAAPSNKKPSREVLLGGAFFGQEYERVVGRRAGTEYDYCAGEDRPYSVDTRAYRQTQSGWFSLGFRGRRASGLRIEAEGRALVGRDRLERISEGPTDAPVAPRRVLQAGSLGVAFDHPSYHVRATVLGGVFHAAGDRIETATGSALFRAIAPGGAFAEARVAQPRLYLSTGEFSYIGAGWQFGAFGPRISAGFGQGGILSVHVPVRTLELDASIHTPNANVLPRGVTPGTSLQVGGRLAIPLP